MASGKGERWFYSALDVDIFPTGPIKIMVNAEFFNYFSDERNLQKLVPFVVLIVPFTFYTVMLI